MRTPLVAGNWKMNKTISEARQLVLDMVPGMQIVRGVEKLVCPPFTALYAVSMALDGKDINLGAQNLYWEDKGAFTSEVSPAMVAEICKYVIIGHSERRQLFGETDETVNKRVKAAQAHGIVPIVCVGETLEEREAEQAAVVVSTQMLEGLKGIEVKSGDDLVIAYEPVWAIGTGRASTPDDAASLIGQVIRPSLTKLFGEEIAQQVRVLYGGSVKPGNAFAYFSEKEIDGALVGGASLKADDFIGIAEAAAKTV